MQTSKLGSQNSDNRCHDHHSVIHEMIKIGLILLLFFVISIWIMQRSVNAYYLQTYHKPSPLLMINDYVLWDKIWAFGADIGDFLYRQHDMMSESIQQWNDHIVTQYNQHYAFTSEYLMEQQRIYQAQLIQERIEQEKKEKQEQEEKERQLAQRFTLTPHDKIFFAGDSMMQGVAPHVQQYLQKYQIQSINLSKQSTGLAYPSFFDWPKTIEQTLKQQHDIKILAIFLGPNDPWDMMNPATKQMLRFASSNWITEYQSRMASILDLAMQQQVQVIWLTPPNMKKDKLNQQMVDLNNIMHEELDKHDNVLVIDTRSIVGGRHDVYNDYLVKDGKSIKMRSADGIHFTPQGQKILAEELQKHLILMP